MSVGRPRRGCGEITANVAELALGITAGTERAEAIGHLADCHDCRRMVDDLSQVGDAILLLTPTLEPRMGFEAGILAEMRSAPAPPSRVQARGRPGRRRSMAPLLAAVVVALLMAAAGVATGFALSSRDPATRTAIAISDSGDAVCRVFVFGDDRSYVLVDFEAPSAWEADYSIELVVTGESKARDVGRLRLAEGRGSLAARVDAKPQTLESVRMLDSDGQVRYEARFS